MYIPWSSFDLVDVVCLWGQWSLNPENYPIRLSAGLYLS